MPSSEDWTAVLKAVAPKADRLWLAGATVAIEPIGKRFGIDNLVSMAHFLGHMAHESQGLTVFEEGLSYTAKRLVEVWPSRFPTIAAATPYARNPKALANRVYNGRMGNRTGTNDGYDYRGSGPLQHTGRSEFERVRTRTSVDVVARPDDLRDKSNANIHLLAAASYFIDRGALAPAKRGDVTGSTKAINGGTIGLADRKIRIERAKRALVEGKIVFDGVVTGSFAPGGKIEEITISKPLGILDHGMVRVEKTTVAVDHEVADKKTSDEQHDADKRNSKIAATTAAPGGAAMAGGANQAGGLPINVAIGVGIAFAIACVVVAVILWRRSKKNEPLPRFVILDQAGALDREPIDQSPNGK